MNIHAINQHAGKIGQAVQRIKEVQSILEILNRDDVTLKISVGRNPPSYSLVELTGLKDSEVECRIFIDLISEYNDRLKKYELTLKELVIRSAETLLVDEEA